MVVCNGKKLEGLKKDGEIVVGFCQSQYFTMMEDHERKTGGGLDATMNEIRATVGNLPKILPLETEFV